METLLIVLLVVFLAVLIYKTEKKTEDLVVNVDSPYGNSHRTIVETVDGITGENDPLNQLHRSAIMDANGGDPGPGRDYIWKAPGIRLQSNAKLSLLPYGKSFTQGEEHYTVEDAANDDQLMVSDVMARGKVATKCGNPYGATGRIPRSYEDIESVKLLD